MAPWERILAIWGFILLAIGVTVAVLHLVAWARWRINEWLWQRRDRGQGGDGWIRPPSVGGNRNIKL